jgi:myo-inositol-1(or 4)-monophosphatase
VADVGLSAAVSTCSQATRDTPLTRCRENYVLDEPDELFVDFEHRPVQELVWTVGTRGQNSQLLLGYLMLTLSRSFDTLIDFGAGGIATDIMHGMINSYASLDDAGVAIAAAHAGADVVRNMYGQQLTRIDKGAGDFATAADVEAERTILGVIRAARPEDAVLGEEGGQQGIAEAGRQWLVDPLCGTLNYAVGNMLVAVNVALRDGAAAVADPFSGEVFFTDGETAWARHNGADAQLVPTSATQLVDVNLDPPFPNAPGFRAVEMLAHPGFIERFRPRVVSTTLALAWVAAGKRAAYVTDGGDLSESVHFAAGIALCRAAGCVVTGIDGARIGQGGRGLVVAADTETHGLLMSVIRDRSENRT